MTLSSRARGQKKTTSNKNRPPISPSQCWQSIGVVGPTAGDTIRFGPRPFFTFISLCILSVCCQRKFKLICHHPEAVHNRARKSTCAESFDITYRQHHHHHHIICDNFVRSALQFGQWPRLNETNGTEAAGWAANAETVEWSGERERERRWARWGRCRQTVATNRYAKTR